MCLLCDAGSDETSAAGLTTLNSFGTSHLKEQALEESPEPLASPMSSMDQPHQASVGREAPTDQAASTGRSLGQQQQDRPALPASVFGSSTEPTGSEQQPTGLQVPASAFGSSGVPESGEQQQAQPSVPASAFGGGSASVSGEQQQGRPSMPGSAFGSSDHLADREGPMVLPTSPFEQARTSGTAAASLGAAQQSSARPVNAQGLDLCPSKNVLPPRSSFAAEEVQAAGLGAQARATPGQALELRPSKNVLPPRSSFAADEVQAAGLEAEARAARGQALAPRPSKNVLPPKSSFAADEVQAAGLYQGSEGSPAQARGLQDAQMPASGFATPEGGESPLREGGREPQAPAAAAPSAGAASDQGAEPSQAAGVAHGEGQAGPASGSEPAPQPGTADGSIRRWGRAPAIGADPRVHQAILGAAEWNPCWATILAGLQQGGRVRTSLEHGLCLCRINSISSPRRKAPPPPGRGPGLAARQSNVGVKQQVGTSCSSACMMLPAGGFAPKMQAPAALQVLHGAAASAAIVLPPWHCIGCPSVSNTPCCCVTARHTLDCRTDALPAHCHLLVTSAVCRSSCQAESLHDPTCTL